MNKWQEVVKRVSKAHPGKSLKQILPIAKAKYRKMKPMSEHSTKKHKKRGTKHTRGLKKKRRGSRKMRGGSSCYSDHTGTVLPDDTLAGAESFEDGYGSFEDVSLTGGSHCGSHKKMAKSHKRKPKLQRRKAKSGRRRRMNGGNVGCPGACPSA